MMKLEQQSRITAIEILKVVGVDLHDCAEKLVRRLRQKEGVFQADVNCNNGKIYVEYDPSKVSLEELRTIVQATTFQFDDTKVISLARSGE